ncbi:hypothetical protein CDAR_313031 [Caerostris darwini]|uniref:Uncharacterized protein n=1 Tax=Caerostris darwini TaxID=1538125 RepID=A0AAV4RY36_9ARAC|nr:hypothetical protein CDAR_313031 [Caerostris darwini]
MILLGVIQYNIDDKNVSKMRKKNKLIRVDNLKHQIFIFAQKGLSSTWHDSIGDESNPKLNDTTSTRSPVIPQAHLVSYHKAQPATEPHVHLMEATPAVYEYPFFAVITFDKVSERNHWRLGTKLQVLCTQLPTGRTAAPLKPCNLARHNYCFSLAQSEDKTHGQTDFEGCFNSILRFSRATCKREKKN